MHKTPQSIYHTIVNAFAKNMKYTIFKQTVLIAQNVVTTIGIIYINVIICEWVYICIYNTNIFYKQKYTK